MNRVVHFEINADDVERASKFYRAVFGWKIEPWGPPEYGYMHVETGDSTEPGIDGGIWKGQGATPKPGSRLNAYNCSVEVASIDDTIAKIKAVGGSVVRDKAQVSGCRMVGDVFGYRRKYLWPDAAITCTSNLKRVVRNSSVES